MSIFTRWITQFLKFKIRLPFINLIEKKEKKREWMTISENLQLLTFNLLLSINYLFVLIQKNIRQEILI